MNQVCIHCICLPDTRYDLHTRRSYYRPRVQLLEAPRHWRKSGHLLRTTPSRSHRPRQPFFADELYPAPYSFGLFERGGYPGYSLDPMYR